VCWIALSALKDGQLVTVPHTKFPLHNFWCIIQKPANC